MNVVVGQRVSTFNIFGISVSEGTPLYFIIKKGPPDDILVGYDVNYDAASVGQKRSLTGDAKSVEKEKLKRKVATYVWKLIPVCK